MYKKMWLLLEDFDGNVIRLKLPRNKPVQFFNSYLVYKWDETTELFIYTKEDNSEEYIEYIINFLSFLYGIDIQGNDHIITTNCKEEQCINDSSTKYS